jgi:hypothetical protein
VPDLPSLIHYLVDMCTAPGTCQYNLHSLVILEDTIKSSSTTSKHCIVLDQDYVSDREESDNSDETLMSKSNSSKGYTVSDEESSGNSEDLNKSLMKFFQDRMVTRLVVIERPHTSCQLYVAEDLPRQHYHFSCPTVTIPFLYQAIRSQNNIDLELLFIPRKCKHYTSETISVYNGIDNGTMLSKIDIEDVTATTFGRKRNGKQHTYSKRSSNSVSIGLQTMYSHEQHSARYCMLPHSKPHIPTVKRHPLHLRRLLLSGYKTIHSLLQHDDEYKREHHPFYNGNKSAHEKSFLSSRNSLRCDLLQHLQGDDVELDDEYGFVSDVMFEACSMQLTGALRCHKDVMNCPVMDRTIALHVPFMSKDADDLTCVSLLYYTRKCVSDYAGRMSKISQYLQNDRSCDLTKLTIHSMMKVGCNFDYQSLFQHEKCLNEIGTVLENEESTSCQDIKTFCGMSCFKKGAAFDKMGYYSIFVNVFMTMYYKDIISSVDDFISLCMYFGLLCNGTSSLVAIWNRMQCKFEYTKEWCSRKKDKTRLFRLLVFFDKEGHGDRNNALVGNCKLPRYQFANYAENIIGQATNIHDILTNFLRNNNNAKTVKKANVTILHSTLFKHLKGVKGIGPLNFNQLWHSLCLCGLLPHEFIKSSAVGISTGPAMLIQSFYPKLKSAQALQKKLQSVRSVVNKIGMNQVSEFFLENMYCEQWRQGMKSKLINKDMPPEERKIQFSSNGFQDE